MKPVAALSKFGGWGGFVGNAFARELMGSRSVARTASVRDCPLSSESFPLSIF